MAGGGSVDNDQVLLLTREIATVGAKQDTMMEMIREMKSNFPTKNEMIAADTALEQRVTRLEEDSKHKQAMIVAWISAFAAVGSWLYLVFRK